MPLTTPQPPKPSTPARLPRLSGVAAVLLALALVGSACGRDRLYGERSRVGKAYHNFTAHYNGYFNADELIDEAERQLTDAEQPDYTQILPVYPAYASDNAASVVPLLDQAMEKVSLVVNIHRPSDYDDDSYLLLGRAQLLKQDYEAAQHTLEYSVAEFDPENEAARLRRIEKDRIAKAKAADKEARARGGSTPGASRPTRARPQRRKGSPPAKRRTSARSSSRGKTSGASASAPSKSKKGAKSKGKRKTRAEMAREQREARLAAEKEAAREAARAEEEAARALERAAEVEAERQAKLAAGEVPDAADALEDGAGLAAPLTDERRPKHGIFVHEDARQDFDFWLARTYIARGRYVDAERLLGELARSGATFKRIRRQLPAAYADMYLRREQIDAAVPYLEDAVALARNKRDRARYAFILGQARQRLGDSRGAIASFRRVVKLKPAFDLAFNARLNLLTTEYRVGEATAAATLRELRRMSKEDKFAPQRDQIFYEMADIALGSGDREQGIALMRESLAANTGNAAQAARGYLRLANLFFEDDAYVLASNYFDSTLQVLPNDDPRYAEVLAYRDNLAPIAANLSTIALQDSLLAIAALDPGDQERFARVLLERQREAELAAAIAASRRAAAAPAAAARRPRSARPVARRRRRRRRPPGDCGRPGSHFFRVRQPREPPGRTGVPAPVGQPPVDRQLAYARRPRGRRRRRRRRLPAASRRRNRHHRRRHRRRPRRRPQRHRGPGARQRAHRRCFARARAPVPRQTREPATRR